MKKDKSFDRPFLPFMPAFSSKPGTQVKQVNFFAGKCYPSFKTAIFTVQPAAESKLDVHKVFEMWLIASGSGIVEYQYKQVPVKAGDVLYFDSLAAHKIINTGKKTIKIFSIWWE